MRCWILLSCGVVGPDALRRPVLLPCGIDWGGTVRCWEVLSCGGVERDLVPSGQLLPGWVVGGDRVWGRQLLSRRIVEPDRVPGGQLLSRGVGGPYRMPRGQLLPCMVFEPQRVSARQLLSVDGARRCCGVRGREILPQLEYDERDGVHCRQLLSWGLSGPDSMPRWHMVEWVWSEKQRDVCGLRGGQVRGDGGIDWVQGMLGGELIVGDGVEHQQRVRAVHIRAVL